MKKFLITLAAGLSLCFAPTQSQADWTDDNAFWGIVGFGTGYMLGSSNYCNTYRPRYRSHYSNYNYGYYNRHHYRRPRVSFGYSYSSSSCYTPAYRPTYVQSYPSYEYNTTTTAPAYYREKRAFPFYHKVEVYNSAPTTPVVSRPEAVSLADNPELTPSSLQRASMQSDQTDSQPAQTEEKPRIEINIGDNNSDVNISVGLDSNSGTEKEVSWNRSPASAVVAVENNTTTRRGRYVDLSNLQVANSQLPSATESQDAYVELPQKEY